MLLENGDFERGWWRKTHTGQEFGEIYVPEGWTCFWREGGVPLPHDPLNTQGYRRPECKLIERIPPFLDPLRIGNGLKAWQCFTFYGIHDAGLYQQVQVAPGTRLRLTAMAHAWSSQGDDPHHSEGAGTLPYFATFGSTANHDQMNFTFRVGIDPRGGTDPFSANVMWGLGAHIYNAYAEIPALEIKAEDRLVTVFVRSQVLWPFKHCDAYIDRVVLEEIGEAACRGDPRVQYQRVVNVLPPTTTMERATEIFAVAWQNGRQTVGGSYDDAGLGNLDDRTAVLWDIPLEEQEIFEEWYADNYPGVHVKFAGAADDEPLWLTYPTTHLPPVVTSPYGPRDGSFHYGIDLRSSWAVWGDQLLAALDGEVVLTGIEPGREYFGEQVQIRSMVAGQEIVTRYAHMVPEAQGGIYVRKGQRVMRGVRIGRPDNTGVSTADHLHFDVRINGQYVNPETMIRWPGEVTPPLPEPTNPAAGQIMGLHLQDWGDKAAVLDFCSRVKPAVMKVFEPEMAPEIKSASPETKVVYRHHIDRAMELACLESPIPMAAWFLDQFAERVRPYVENGQIAYIETAINETMDGDRVAAAVAFELAFIAELKRRLPRARPLVATIAVGNPHESQYALLLPLAEEIARVGGAFGYHAYWPVERGVSYLESDWPWHAGRFEGMDAFFRARGFTVDWILSECGPCGGLMTGDDSGRWFAYDPAAGWKSSLCFGGDWPRTMEDVNEFRWRLASSPARVLGATWFTVCTWDWDNFHLDGAQMATL